METLYIVSYGDSRQYRVRFEGTKEQLAAQPFMKELEREMQKYIESAVAEGSHAARFTVPEIREVAGGRESEYDAYPELDINSAKEIESILLTEVKDMESVKKLNLNAPYDED